MDDPRWEAIQQRHDALRDLRTLTVDPAWVGPGQAAL